MKLFLASTWFQLCWFAAVLGTYHWQWLTLALTLATLLYCFRCDVHSLKSISIITMVGVVLDTINQQLSILVFSTQWLPTWLLCLWGMFSWYAYQLKPILYRFPKPYVSLVGGFGGAMSYLAGFKLQAVEFGFGPSVTLALLFAQWCVMMLVILKVYGNEEQDNKLETETD